MAIAGGAPVQTEMFPGQEQEQQDVIQRTKPEVDPARSALVNQWAQRVKEAKEHHKDAFKRMREDMVYARLGSDKTWVANDHYTVPIINRHINNAVASLYAKNPQAEVKLKERMETVLWDGSITELQTAVGMAGAGDPMATQLLMEAEQVKQHKSMLKRVGNTLKILFNYYLDEPSPNFKQQFKQLIRRAKVTGVGYVKVDFQRLLEKDPEVSAKLDDATQKFTRLQNMLADAADDEISEGEARLEELRLLLQDLQAKEDIVVREGPVFDFPRSTEIIVDPNCRQLKGFIGADWVAHEYMLTPEKVQEIYGVDVKQAHLPYAIKADEAPRQIDNSERRGGKQEHSLAAVWEVWNKQNGQVFTVCDGYPDFLREPAAPDVKTEGFWTIFALVLNPIEDCDELYPLSDVHMLKHPQREYNRSRQSLREHRIANRPVYATRKGLLSDEDKAKLQARPANAILELKALAETQSVENALQAIKPAPVDPALYETNSVMEDVLRGVGSQEANIGGLSGATATESTIAEQGRLSSLEANVDDIDELLTEIARAVGHLMLLELGEDTVKEIVGPGAVWPQWRREEIAKEVFLMIKAGSTGRPNKAAELANRERAMPFLLQMPGLNPIPFLRDYVELLDIDIDEAVIEGLPSITAQNSMAGKQSEPGTGDPQTDPNAQGGEGAENSPAPDERQPGPQPAFPGEPGQNPRGNLP